MELTAVHSQRRIGWPGILSISEEGIDFTPTRISRETGGKGFRVDAADVDAVEVEPRRFWPLAADGQYMRRLRIETRTVGSHFFVVRNVDEVVRRTREIIRGTPGG